METKCVDTDNKTFQLLYISPRGEEMCISKQLHDIVCVCVNEPPCH